MRRLSNPAHIQTAILAEVARRRLREQMSLQPIKEVDKTWGYEWWIINTPEYCGKHFLIRRGKCSSEGKYHYHKIKDETFYVDHGILILDWVDVGNKFHTIDLKRGMAFRIRPGIKHRFSTKTIGGCRFTEFSTGHVEEDSYRCYYDENKGEWIE
jgi:mannose-6-phosphate isomerase-like protein (cupin superfamily)